MLRLQAKCLLDRTFEAMSRQRTVVVASKLLLDGRYYNDVILGGLLQRIYSCGRVALKWT